MKSIRSYLSLFGLLFILIMVSACKGDDIPPNEAPVIADQSFSVAEDIADKAIIGMVQASDPDEDALSFSITGTVELNGNRDFTGLFEINEETGALSLADGQSLNYEDATGFAVTVSVSDEELTATASITITVTDVNMAPVITDQTFSAAENIADAVIIGTMQASDPDEDALSFSITEIVEANDNRDFTGLFKIDETTGELSLAAGQSLDYEDATGFLVTVSVSDSELTTKASITVNVTDVEETTGFVTTWRTTTANETIGFFTNPYLTYDYHVDWGDGTVETNITGSPTQTYASAGDYQVAISGTFPAIQTNGARQLISIDEWGDIEWETMSFAFTNMYEFAENASDAPDLSRVTDMSGMFSGCVFFTGDFNNWDVSNVTDMSEMFSSITISNVNIADWDVSNVTDMSGMFSSSGGLSTNISSWDVSNVTDMSGMFSHASSAGDLSSWDVSNVTNMRGMFAFARSINPDIGSWDVSKVTDMNGMFRLAGVFNGDISNWDVSNVTDMSLMFSGAFRFNQDIGNWDVSRVTNMGGMFLMPFDVYIRNDPSDFNQDIGDWDVSNVTEMGAMFSGTLRFNQNISNWDVGNVTNMTGMFAVPLDPNKPGDPPDFNQDIGSWDVSNVINMSTMFRFAIDFNQDLTQWDVAGVTDCSEFSRDSGLVTTNRPDFTNCNPD